MLASENSSIAIGGEAAAGGRRPRLWQEQKFRKELYCTGARERWKDCSACASLPAKEVFGLGLSNTGGSIKIFSENEVFLQLSSLMDGQSCDSIDRVVTDERAPVEGCVVNPLSSITMMS